MPKPQKPGRMLVVAAVVRQAGRILIGQRRKNDSHGLKWEFPGGKVEVGESPTEALRRELNEELRIEAEIGDEIGRYQFRYPGRRPLILVFYEVPAFLGEPESTEFQQIRWVLPEELHDYDFLDGDRDIVRRLSRQKTG